MKTHFISTLSATHDLWKTSSTSPSVPVLVRTQRESALIAEDAWLKFQYNCVSAVFPRACNIQKLTILPRLRALPRPPAPRVAVRPERVKRKGLPSPAARPQVALSRRPLPSRPPPQRRPPGGRAGGARHVGGAERTRRPIARCDAPPEAGRALKMAAGAPSGSARQ